VPDSLARALAVVLLFSAGCSFEIPGLGGNSGQTVDDGGAGDASPAVDDAADPDLASSPDLAQPPELTGTAMPSAATADLTALGTTDWVHFGIKMAADINRKATGGSLISTFSSLKNKSPAHYGDNQVSFRWSDGAPTVSQVGTTTGVYLGGMDEGFAFTVPADTTERTVVVFVGGYLSSAIMVAHLSDGSAPDFTSSTFTNLTGSYGVTATLKYRASAANQTLLIGWKQTSPGGNVTLQAIALN
jgi:hypothetical protein